MGKKYQAPHIMSVVGIPIMCIGVWLEFGVGNAFIVGGVSCSVVGFLYLLACHID